MMNYPAIHHPRRQYYLHLNESSAYTKRFPDMVNHEFLLILSRKMSSRSEFENDNNFGSIFLKCYYDQKIISFFPPIFKAYSLNIQLAKF